MCLCVSVLEGETETDRQMERARGINREFGRQNDSERQLSSLLREKEEEKKGKVRDMHYHRRGLMKT